MKYLSGFSPPPLLKMIRISAPSPRLGLRAKTYTAFSLKGSVSGHIDSRTTNSTHYAIEAFWYACRVLRNSATGPLVGSGGGGPGAGLGEVLPLTSDGFWYVGIIIRIGNGVDGRYCVPRSCH